MKKYGAFDIDGEIAREWLRKTGNPNRKQNSDVLRPWLNGADVVRRSSDTWVIDFYGLGIVDASQYERPFEHAKGAVQPVRSKDRNAVTRDRWWLFERNRPELREQLDRLNRFIVTPVVAKHRIFLWCASPTLPANLLDVVTCDDDTMFGILHSKIHEIWSIRKGTFLGVGNDPRYTPTTTFETFPFPEGLTPNILAKDYESDSRAQRIAAAAKKLNEQREAWLNPPELVRREPEVVPGYPDRLIARGVKAEAELKKRTLTNLYNQRPAWLDLAHKVLDEAVAAAYGWPADLSDDEILSRLLTLNREQAAKQKQ